MREGIQRAAPEFVDGAKLFTVFAEPFDAAVEKLALVSRMQGFSFEAKETFDEAELGGMSHSSIAGNPLSIMNEAGGVERHGASCVEKWADLGPFPLLSKSPSNRLVTFLLDLYAEEFLTPALKGYRFGSSAGEQELRTQLPSLPSGRMEQFCWLNRQKRQLKLYGINEANNAANQAHVQRVLEQLDRQIKNSGYLSGIKPGFIDVTFFAPLYTYLYRQHFYRAELEGRFPSLVGWLKEMASVGKLEESPREVISLSDPILNLLNIVNKDCSSMVAALTAAYQQWLKDMSQEFRHLPAYIGMCSGVCMQQKVTRVVSVNFLWHMQRIVDLIAAITPRDGAPVQAILKTVGLEILLEQVQLFKQRKLIFSNGDVYLQAQY